jgi:hypothetical protein
MILPLLVVFTQLIEWLVGTRSSGTRTDIRSYLKVLERQYIFRSGAVDQTHIDTIMANKEKCLRLTAPRSLTAAVLLEDIE